MNIPVKKKQRRTDSIGAQHALLEESADPRAVKISDQAMQTTHNVNTFVFSPEISQWQVDKVGPSSPPRNKDLSSIYSDDNNFDYDSAALNPHIMKQRMTQTTGVGNGGPTMKALSKRKSSQKLREYLPKINESRNATGKNPNSTETNLHQSLRTVVAPPSKPKTLRSQYSLDQFQHVKAQFKLRQLEKMGKTQTKLARSSQQIKKDMDEKRQMLQTMVQDMRQVLNQRAGSSGPASSTVSLDQTTSQYHQPQHQMEQFNKPLQSKLKPLDAARQERWQLESQKSQRGVDKESEKGDLRDRDGLIVNDVTKLKKTVENFDQASNDSYSSTSTNVVEAMQEVIDEWRGTRAQRPAIKNEISSQLRDAIHRQHSPDTNRARRILSHRHSRSQTNFSPAAGRSISQMSLTALEKKVFQASTPFFGTLMQNTAMVPQSHLNVTHTSMAQRAVSQKLKAIQRPSHNSGQFNLRQGKSSSFETYRKVINQTSNPSRKLSLLYPAHSEPISSPSQLFLTDHQLAAGDKRPNSKFSAAQKQPKAGSAANQLEVARPASDKNVLVDMRRITPKSTATFVQMDFKQKNHIFYNQFDKRVTPADFQLLQMDEENKHASLREMKKKLANLQAESLNYKFKMDLMTKKAAAKEIFQERQLEKFYQRVVDSANNNFGIAAQRFAQLLLKHARMDFRWDLPMPVPHEEVIRNVQSIPTEEDQYMSDSSSQDSGTSVTSVAHHSDNQVQLSHDQATPKMRKTKAWKKLEKIMLGTNKHPWQKQQALGFSTEEVKYMHRIINSALKSMKRIQADQWQEQADKLTSHADQTTQKKIMELQEKFERETLAFQLYLKALAEGREQFSIRLERLHRLTKKQELQELHGFDLIDRRRELNFELEISNDIDKEIMNGIKFEKHRNKTLVKQMRRLQVEAYLKERQFITDRAEQLNISSAVYIRDSNLDGQADESNSKAAGKSEHHREVLPTSESIKKSLPSSPSKAAVLLTERSTQLKNKLDSRTATKEKQVATPITTKRCTFNVAQDQDDINFIDECQGLAAELSQSIAQSRRARMLIRKNQNELTQERQDFKALMRKTQRDFELAVAHTKTLINVDKKQRMKSSKDIVYTYSSHEQTTDFSSEENSTTLAAGEHSTDPLVKYKEEQKLEMLEYLQSKLRMVILLRERTFPPARDIVLETVQVLSLPEQTARVVKSPKKQPLPSFTGMASPQAVAQSTTPTGKKIIKIKQMAKSKSQMETAFKTKSEFLQQQSTSQQHFESVVEARDEEASEQSLKEVDQNQTEIIDSKDVSSQMIDLDDDPFPTQDNFNAGNYRSKSAQAAPQATRIIMVPTAQLQQQQFKASKLPSVSKEVFKSFTARSFYDKNDAAGGNRTGEKYQYGQRSIKKGGDWRLRGAMALARTSENNIRQANIKQSPSPRHIGISLPVSIRKDIRLPFIQKQQLSKDRKTTSKYLIRPIMMPRGSQDEAQSQFKMSTSHAILPRHNQSARHPLGSGITQNANNYSQNDLIVKQQPVVLLSQRVVKRSGDPSRHDSLQASSKSTTQLASPRMESKHNQVSIDSRISSFVDKSMNNFQRIFIANKNNNPLSQTMAFKSGGDADDPDRVPKFNHYLHSKPASQMTVKRKSIIKRITLGQQSVKMQSEAGGVQFGE